MVGSGRRLLVEPNLLPDREGPSGFETSWYGHEGPLEACSAYRVPVSAFEGENVVTLTLHFRDDAGVREEVHDPIAHLLLHMAIDGVPINLDGFDAVTAEAAPFIIESALDPRVRRWPHTSGELPPTP